jgi:hypothetical protein
MGWSVCGLFGTTTSRNLAIDSAAFAGGPWLYANVRSLDRAANHETATVKGVGTRREGPPHD